jgi:hypothetical protein
MKRLSKQEGSFDGRIAVLARRVSKLKRDGAGKVNGGFPRKLRADILAMLDHSGLPVGPFGKRVGVTGTTLANWIRAKSKDARSTRRRRDVRRPKTGKQKRSGFREVRVVGDAASAGLSKPKSFELSLPSGARITGLGMEDIAKLIGVQAVVR